MGIFILIITPINSVQGGLENICYNYHPTDTYYETYPEQLNETQVEGVVLEKYVESGYTYLDMYTQSEYTYYYITLSINFDNVNYKQVKKVSKSLFDKVIKNQTVPVTVTTTNCYKTDKQFIKYVEDTIYFDLT